MFRAPACPLPQILPRRIANTIADTKHESKAQLKVYEKNFAGTVTLDSTNPLDIPNIMLNLSDARTTLAVPDST